MLYLPRIDSPQYGGNLSRHSFYAGSFLQEIGRCAKGDHFDMLIYFSVKICYDY